MHRDNEIEFRLDDETLAVCRFTYCRTTGFSEEESYHLCKKTFKEIEEYRRFKEKFEREAN